MGDLLQKLLNEVVVTPYDPGITSRLEAICETMAEKVTVENINRYIASFVFNKPDWEIKKAVEDKYQEIYPEEDPLILPPLFAIVLSQNITIEAITRKLEGRNRATASLILMNYMFYRKGSLTRLILPNHITDMYYKLDSYIDEKDTISIVGEQNHLGDILSKPNYLNEHYNDEDMKREVREMAKMTTLYKYRIIIDKYKKEKEKNLFVRVYDYLVEIIGQTKWLFMKNDIKRLLSEVVSEDEQKKQYTIESIVNELIKAKVTLPYDNLEESSLLLRYIKGQDGITAELKNKRLTVMEFGVYVYYELLLEHIIGEYYGNRKADRRK